MRAPDGRCADARNSRWLWPRSRVSMMMMINGYREVCSFRLPHAKISGPQGGVKHLLFGCERPKSETPSSCSVARFTSFLRSCTPHWSPCDMCNFCPLSVISPSRALMKIRKSSGDSALPCATPVSKVIVSHCGSLCHIGRHPNC